MSNVNETGHSVNVDHFLEMKTIVNSLGRSYSPANPLIQVENLETFFVSCKTANDGVAEPLVAWKGEVAKRQLLMNPLSKLVTRVIRALKSSGAGDEQVAQATGFARKIQGARASKQTDETDETRTVSSSQLSVSQRISNFRTLIEFLTTIPSYAPTPEELTLTSLQTMLANMEAANVAVIAAEAILTKARQHRDDLLYSPSTGLVAVAQLIKDEIAAVFGFGSPVHKQVLRIKFSNQR